MLKRSAAKGLISVGERELLFVKGSRGLWNLPGGGVNPRAADGREEGPREAFLRELQEETSATASQLDHLRKWDVIEGETSDAHGNHHMTTWHLFRAVLLVPVDELYVPPESEVTAIAAMSPEELMKIPEVDTSMLARRAVIRWANDHPAAELR